MVCARARNKGCRGRCTGLYFPGFFSLEQEKQQEERGRRFFFLSSSCDRVARADTLAVDDTDTSRVAADMFLSDGHGEVRVLRPLCTAAKRSLKRRDAVSAFRSYRFPVFLWLQA